MELTCEQSFVGKVSKKMSDLLYGEDHWVRKNGSFREQQMHGLIGRANYCYGMLRAADQAKYLGYKEVIALEFGVSSGAGLLNMVELSKLIYEETGVNIKVVGFDAGDGLPSVQGYKDHAELWMDGDFSMEDRRQLLEKTKDDASIIFGDINDTIQDFMQLMSKDCPIGFISVDVDIYTGTVGALKSLLGDSNLYLPAISIYFDDISFFYANKWCGELLAIKEFNERNDLRKIDLDHSLPGHRPKRYEPWYKAMYVCHILDHVVRNKGVQRESLTIGKHYDFMKSNFLY